MDRHVKKQYKRVSDDDPGGRFHEVIALHEAPDIPWRILSKKVPLLPRGWYELSLLSPQDRIEFCRDYWLSKLPYQASMSGLNRFFGSLDDIGIFLTQNTWEDPFEVNMVYSVSGDRGFYSGGIPASEEKISALQEVFSNYTLPNDYKVFLQIHDGFCKATDCTGITPTCKMKDSYLDFQEMIQGNPPLTTSKGKMVNPHSLIPFYESFGIPFFQCFWAEWYPEQEMGNVYFSHTTKTISDVNNGETSTETMAFPSFLDWLIFYLEPVV